MKDVCLFEVDVPQLEAGIREPQMLLRIYANGALIVDEEIPTDTVMLGITAAKGSTLMVLTGQNDKSTGLNPTWVTNPARINGEEIDKGDYSRVEHVHETQADDSELREGLVTFGVRTKDQVDATEPVVEVLDDSIPMTEETQPPASSDQLGTTPDLNPEEVTTTLPPENPASSDEPTTSEGPLV